MGLELLQGLLGVVDQSEAGALATTVLRAEPENGDLVLVGLVQVGQLLAELVLGDVRAVGVEDVPAREKTCQSRGSCKSNSPSPCFFSFVFLLASMFRVVVCDCAVLGAMCVFSMSSSNPPGRPISSAEIAKKGGILTRPSACGQAEGCG